MHVAVAVLSHEQRRQTGKPEEAEQSPRKLITVLFRLNNGRSSWLCHDGSGRKGCHQGCRAEVYASGHVHLSILAARTPNWAGCSAAVVVAPLDQFAHGDRLEACAQPAPQSVAREDFIARALIPYVTPVYADTYQPAGCYIAAQ
jgi:hypothetical protein